MNRHVSGPIKTLLIVVLVFVLLYEVRERGSAFVERGFRNEISRAHDDLRAIGMAMESYRNDHHTYPASEADSPLGACSRRFNVDLRLLTTPTAYLSAIPEDVFLVESGAADRRYSVFAAACDGSATTYVKYPRTAWIALSVGPDFIPDATGYRKQKDVLKNEYASTYKFEGRYLGLRFDPTNGLRSSGDIYLWGGE